MRTDRKIGFLMCLCIVVIRNTHSATIAPILGTRAPSVGVAVGASGSLSSGSQTNTNLGTSGSAVVGTQTGIDPGTVGVRGTGSRIQGSASVSSDTTITTSTDATTEASTGSTPTALGSVNINTRTGTTRFTSTSSPSTVSKQMGVDSSPVVSGSQSGSSISTSGTVSTGTLTGQAVNAASVLNSLANKSQTDGETGTEAGREADSTKSLTTGTQTGGDNERSDAAVSANTNVRGGGESSMLSARTQTDGDIASVATSGSQVGTDADATGIAAAGTRVASSIGVAVGADDQVAQRDSGVISNETLLEGNETLDFIGEFEEVLMDMMDPLLRYRSEASGNKSLHLINEDNKAIHITICAKAVNPSQPVEVQLADIVYSNDGAPDNITLKREGEIVGEAATEAKTNWGKEWNIFKNTGPIGTVQSLSEGTHNFTLIISTDQHGIELDKADFRARNQDPSKNLLCEAVLRNQM